MELKERLDKLKKFQDHFTGEQFIEIKQEAFREGFSHGWIEARKGYVKLEDVINILNPYIKCTKPMFADSITGKAIVCTMLEEIKQLKEE